MPIVTVKTNVSWSKVPQDMHYALTDIGSKYLKKPRSVVWVNVECDCHLTQGATYDPAAVVNVECIGRLKPGVNYNMGREIENILVNSLSIPRDRIVIRFEKVPALYCTYNGALHATSIEYDEDLES